MSEAANDRRYKPNLQGLLNFCTEYTKTEDAPQFSEAMPPEKREWLKKALEGMTSNDPIKKMIEDLKCLIRCYIKDEKKDGGEGGDEVSLQDREVALENLIMYCEDLDLANDFYNIGGFEVLPNLLQDTHTTIRVSTASLIATIAQNNPFIQGKVLADPFILPHLLSRVEKEEKDGQKKGEDVEFRIKCLYAISCTIRESHPGQDQFADLSGFKVIQKVIQKSCVPKLKVKALFLLGALCVERDSNKDHVIECGIVADVIDVLKKSTLAQKGGKSEPKKTKKAKNIKGKKKDDDEKKEEKDGVMEEEEEKEEEEGRLVEEMALSALHAMVVDSHSACVLECLKVDAFAGVMEECMRRWQCVQGGKEQVKIIKTIKASCML